MQNTRREIPAYADPNYKPLPKPIGNPYRKFLESLQIKTLTLTWILKRLPHIKKVLYQKCTKGPIGHIFGNYPNWKV